MTTERIDSLILNVDDNDGARYAKSRILTRAGFQVIEAANGEEAIQKAKNQIPDLVLLDTKLPDINGFEVCRRLKENSATQIVLVLQTSASYVGIADKIRALDGGADNYLFEPIEPEELVANVRALLRLGSAERELRDADRRKDVFLATLAHELRNPLGPIRNAVDLLRHPDPQAPKMQENACQIIIRQTDHMVRLVNDLLDVARINQGKITLHPELVEVKTFINAAVEIAGPLLEARRHSLRVALPEDNVLLIGDGIRLTQIVGNLLHNAAKFTPPGGEITLVAEQVGDKFSIKIQDNGIGIPSASVTSIFDLFTQAEHAPGRVQDGLGIGLSLVKNLVELHGGTVSALSAGRGQGSTFEVLLPLTQAETGLLPQPEAEPQSAGDRRRVLVVDDNVDSADMLFSMLQLEGHEVEKSYAGLDAIDSARRFRPEVVFLDIGLPDLDGYEVAAKLRELPGMDGVVLVALTGYGRDKDRDRALAAGFNLHLVKPVTLRTLLLTISGKDHL